MPIGSSPIVQLILSTQYLSFSINYCNYHASDRSKVRAGNGIFSLKEGGRLVDIFLAFGNIFLGIIIIMVVAKTWAWVEKFFLYKLSPLKRYILLLVLTIAVELMMIYLISQTFSLSLIDSMFITGFILLIFIWTIPYYSGFTTNFENTVNSRNGSSKQSLHLFTPKLTPFFVGSLGVSIACLLISIGRYYL